MSEGSMRDDDNFHIIQVTNPLVYSFLPLFQSTWTVFIYSASFWGHNASISWPKVGEEVIQKLDVREFGPQNIKRRSCVAWGCRDFLQIWVGNCL
jgi:hypothetical protein